MSKEPIINCHTHIFTGDHVPPYLAKTFVPWPLHIFLPLRPLIYFFRWWYKGPATIKYTAGYKKSIKWYTDVQAFLTRGFPVNIFLGYYLFFFAFFMLYSLLFPDPGKGWVWLFNLSDKVAFLFPNIEAAWLKILIIISVSIFFKAIRNLLLFSAKLLSKAVSKLPGKQTKEMFSRYMNIGRYAFHREQKTILSKLKFQYPAGTRFIVLPMDMDYMEAGNSKVRYRDQMAELAAVTTMKSNKETLYPFVFADPRRLVPAAKEKRYRTGDKDYFTWSAKEGKVILGDCFLKDFLETKEFSGIKIYPALGYYPFDEKLLPLWKYAADNRLPVLTHCIRGTIFYRGLKKDKWNQHPVFQQAAGSNNEKKSEENDEEQLETEIVSAYEPLVLPQFSNADYSINFTHPLNYICLYEEELLRKIVGNSSDTVKELFGYNGDNDKMDHDLCNLKICMGHFGGEDEWKRYFEKDRYDLSSQLTKYPDTGISFLTKADGTASRGKPEQLWKHTDWYSIICSMMLQYNVYADISYILHGDKDILPLLKQTLTNKKLKKKVLYGTDFFVVRNHKSDKHMLADMMGGLSEEDFDQIARINPKHYLKG